MAEGKTIHIFVTFDRRETRQVTIPYEIDEVQLKAQLRDLGYISSYRNSYLTTKVYLETENGEIEICKDEYRSLEELGIKENSGIIIAHGEPEPEPRQIYIPGSVRFLYGCPMAHSVEEAISYAEIYSDDDSVVTTGSIGTD